MEEEEEEEEGWLDEGKERGGEGGEEDDLNLGDGAAAEGEGRKREREERPRRERRKRTSRLLGTTMAEPQNRAGHGGAGQREGRGIESWQDTYIHTEMRFILCTWFGEISSCSCLTVLPGPAWVLLNKICKYQISSLYIGDGMRRQVDSTWHGMACQATSDLSSCNRSSLSGGLRGVRWTEGTEHISIA